MLFLILTLVQLLLLCKYTQEACRLQDQHRVDIVQLTSKSSTRRRCQVIRALKKEKDDQNKQAEGFNYGPGQF